MKTRVITSTPVGRRGGCGAFTLVEILVTTAILVVVLGLALGLMLESDKTTREITRQQAAIQYCQVALDEAVRTIRNAVAPANLAGIKDSKRMEPVFKHDELTVIAPDRMTTGTFSRITLANKLGPGNLSAGITRRHAVLAEGVTTSSLADNLGGQLPEGLQPSIRFGYAGTPRPGEKVEYRDDWTSSGLPALVQLTVSARYDKPAPGLSDIVLQTAIIPGLLPPLHPVAAAPPPAENGNDSNVKVITAAPARTLLRPEIKHAVKEASRRP